MPTPIPLGEKTAFLNVINVWNPTEVIWLTVNLKNYEDIPLAIHRWIDYYGSYPNFLTIAMNCFTNATMLSVGIYYQQTISSGPTDNPILIVNSTFVGEVVITNTLPYLDILNGSTIDTLEIQNQFGTLNIASGSTVNLLMAITEGASINNVFIKNLRNNPATLNTLYTSSICGLITVDDGAVYGDTGEVSVEQTCSTPATSLTSSNITTTSITLSWLAPVTSWLYMNLSYRITGTDNWITVDNVIGQFQGDTGYVFTKLLPGQYYDFQVIVVCVNGGYSVPIQITVQTAST